MGIGRGGGSPGSEAPLIASSLSPAGRQPRRQTHQCLGGELRRFSAIDDGRGDVGLKGSKQRVAKLMTAYLPERRLFWARQCAISALALRGDEKTRHSPWKQLALVGRDIASDLPLDQIPLMKQVAEISVRAFERRL